MTLFVRRLRSLLQHPLGQPQGLFQAACGAVFGTGDEYAGQDEVLLLAGVGRYLGHRHSRRPSQLWRRGRVAGAQAFHAPLHHAVSAGRRSSLARQAEGLVQRGARLHWYDHVLGADAPVMALQ